MEQMKWKREHKPKQAPAPAPTPAPAPDPVPVPVTVDLSEMPEGLCVPTRAIMVFVHPLERALSVQDENGADEVEERAEEEGASCG